MTTSGSAFIKRIGPLGYSRARDMAVLDAIDSRVDWPLVALSSTWQGHTATIYVTSDVLAIGTPDDLVRVPVGADVAQVIADELGMMLITPYVAQLIDEQALRRLVPFTEDSRAGGGLAMMGVADLVLENAHIDEQLRAMGATFGDLTSCLGKDVVVCNHCADRPGYLVICGWDLDPSAAVTHWIQPGKGGIALQAAHEIAYRDYSHKHRFMALWMLVDGARMLVADVAKNPELAPLISREFDAHGKPAAWTFLRYPTTSVQWIGSTPATGAPLVPTIPPPAPVLGTVKKGDRGARVIALQVALNRAGSSPQLVADGVFGDATAKSIAFFQVAAALPVTSEGDGPTIAALAALALASGASPPAAPTPSQGPGPDAPTGALGTMLVHTAAEDIGVRESGGHNRGKRIDHFCDVAGVPRGSDYCAPAVMTWIVEAAAAVRITPPIHGSPAAKGFEAQLTACGRWVPRAELAEHVGPGWVLVFDRAPPALEWQGHCCIVEKVTGSGAALVLHTIEANGGPLADGVDRFQHSVGEPLLLGGGSLD